MILYKTIDNDKEIIECVKNGEYPNWRIVREDSILVEIAEQEVNEK